MQIIMQQTHHAVGDFQQIFDDLKRGMELPTEQKSLLLYPELYLSGYPLQDLVVQRSFIENYLEHFENFEKWCLSQKSSEADSMALVGGLHYTFDDEDLPLRIENVIYTVQKGKKLQRIYTKALLPNYDIFDEEKYFSPKERPEVLTFDHKKIGLMICEDMWFSSTHDFDPTTALYELCQSRNLKLDLVVNLSASPYFLGKHTSRTNRASEISKLFQAPFTYINRVGGEDEIQFDGSSFIVNGDKLTHLCKRFEEDMAFVSLMPYQGPECKLGPKEVENTWESLFKASLQFPSTIESELPKLPDLNEKDCEFLIKTIHLGLKDYAEKCGFQKFLVAFSGGIDSALVLALLKIIIGDSSKIETVYMPGLYSSPLSWDLCVEMTQKLQIKLVTQPIKFIHSAIRNSFQDNFKEELAGLADENIQSRIRGSILYARSNQSGAMVLNTSNKSELAVGYSTLYGDSVGAISLLGDLYKSEVYQLAEYINQKYGNLIPEGIINREPSAELREGQTDQQTLPPYARLDAILEGILSYRYSLKDLTRFGFNEEEVKKVYGLYVKSEYKRNQFCPIIKLKAKSFGFGYRVPITKKSN